jgi:hypothetical protein
VAWFSPSGSGWTLETPHLELRALNQFPSLANLRRSQSHRPTPPILPPRFLAYQSPQNYRKVDLLYIYKFLIK